MIFSKNRRNWASDARSFPPTRTKGTPCLSKVRRIHFAGSVLVIASRARMSLGVRRVSPGARPSRSVGARAPSAAAMPTDGGWDAPISGDTDRIAPAFGALACSLRGGTASAGLAAPEAKSLVDMGKTRSSARTGPRPSTRRWPKTRTREVPHDRRAGLPARGRAGSLKQLYASRRISATELTLPGNWCPPLAQNLPNRTRKCRYLPGKYRAR